MKFLSLSLYLFLLFHLLLSLRISLKLSCHSVVVSLFAGLWELALPHLALDLAFCNPATWKERTFLWPDWRKRKFMNGTDWLISTHAAILRH